MFARFIGLRRKLEAGRKRQTVELTVENSGLTPAQLANAKKAMRVLKLDVSAPQTKDKLVIFLYTVGLNPTEDVIDSKLRSLNLHDAQHITFAHFCHVWFAMLQDLSDEEEILRRAFQFFDKDGNGEISVHELRTTMHELGDLLTEDEIMSFMAIMDIDNDGVIGYQEFLSTLKTQAPDNEEDQEETVDEDSSMPVQAEDGYPQEHSYGQHNPGIDGVQLARPQQPVAEAQSQRGDGAGPSSFGRSHGPRPGLRSPSTLEKEESVH